MFSTLRYSNDGLSEKVDSTTPHVACSKCRSKKLKCTGEKDGCHRCRTTNLQCKYPEPSVGKGTKRIKFTSNRPIPKASQPVQSVLTATAPHNASLNNPEPLPSHQQSSPDILAPLLSASWNPNPLVGRPNDDVSLILDTPQAPLDIVTNDGFEPLEKGLYPPGIDFSSLENYLAFPYPEIPETGDIMNRSVQIASDYDIHLASTPLPTSTSLSALEQISDGLFLNCSSPSTNSSLTSDSFHRLYETSNRDLGFRQAHHTSQNNPTPPGHQNIYEELDSMRGPTTEPTTFKEASRSTELAASGSCRCLSIGLSLLETLSIEDARSTLPSAARTLQLNKHVLAQCKRLLQCEFCCGASNFMMLLIVLCQNITTSYERVIHLLTEQYEKLNPTWPSEHVNVQAERETRGNTPGRNHEPGQGDRLTLGDYEVDPEEEPCVYGGLASTQLMALRTLLATMKEVLRNWSWDTHIVIVDSVLERIRMQLIKFNGKSYT